MVYLLMMVFFYSYVSLPEGIIKTNRTRKQMHQGWTKPPARLFIVSHVWKFLYPPPVGFAGFRGKELEFYVLWFFSKWQPPQRIHEIELWNPPKIWVNKWETTFPSFSWLLPLKFLNFPEAENQDKLRAVDMAKERWSRRWIPKKLKTSIKTVKCPWIILEYLGLVLSSIIMYYLICFNGIEKKPSWTSGAAPDRPLVSSKVAGKSPMPQ